MAQTSENIPRMDEERKSKSNDDSKILPPWAQTLIAQASNVGANYLTY